MCLVSKSICHSNRFTIRLLCLLGLSFSVILTSGCADIQGERLTRQLVLEDLALPSPSWVPLPGTALEENLEVVRLRTGVVKLLWWTPAPGNVETVIRRREPGVAEEWVELGRTREVSFVDRTVLSDRQYEYEVEMIGAPADGGGQKAGILVDVGPVVQPLPPRHFAVVRYLGELKAEWSLFPDSPVDAISIKHGSDSEKSLLADVPFYLNEYTWSAVVPEGALFTLETGGDRETDGLPARMEAVLTGGFPPLSELTLRPHPRLFVSTETIEIYKQWAEEDAEMRRALRELHDEANQALRTLRSPNHRIPRARSTDTHTDNIRMTRQLALGWAFTGREDYRQAAVDTLLEYASFYKDIPIVRSYADGHLTGQTLNEAMVMITMVWAYDLLYNSISEADRAKIEEGLFRPAYENISSRNRGASNWQSYHNAAIIAMGLVLDDKEMLESALYGESGLVWQMRNTLGRDGLYYAQSIAYHYFTMSAFTVAAAILYENGIDLFAYRDGKRSLRNMYDVPFYHAMSNGNQAPFGNSQITYDIAAQWIAWNYAYAYRHYREPAYLWQWEVSRGARRSNDNRMPVLFSLGQIRTAQLENTAAGIPNVAEPMVIGTGPTFSSAIRNVAGSSILEDVGMVVLRGESGLASGESAMIWKPHGKTAGHQHANSLGIYWQSPRHRWISGSGKWASYGDDVHRRWVMKTLSDNTLLVDRSSHAPLYQGAPTWISDEEGKTTAGVLTGFTAGPDFGYAVGYNNRVYGHASIARRHINAGYYALDMMRGESKQEALFENVLHLWGELEKSNLTLREDKSQLAPGNGYQYLKERRSASSSGDWETQWKATESDDRLYLTVLGAPESTYHVARTPWGAGRTRSTLLTSREGWEADFISVWRAAEGADPVLSITPIEDSELSAQIGALRVVLKDGTVDTHIWGPALSEGQWGDIRFRARDLMARSNAQGRLQGVTVVEGDRLQIGEQLSLSLSMPATWSWRALPQGGFVLVYDDDYPVILTLDAKQSHNTWLLDPDGHPGEALTPEDSQVWILPPRSNLLFIPGKNPDVPLPSLVKTVQLGDNR